MPFLTIAGLDVEIQVTPAQRGQPTRIGETARAFDGTLRSTVRGQKHAWTGTTGPLSTTDADALETAIDAAHGLVTVAGDWLGGSFTADVFVTARTPIPDRGAADELAWVLSLQITEG